MTSQQKHPIPMRSFPEIIHDPLLPVILTEQPGQRLEGGLDSHLSWNQ
jgi:hypothetical protein